MANFNFIVMDDARIYIGNNVACGPNVSLLATNHPLLAQERLGLDDNGAATAFAEYADEIHIGNNLDEQELSDLIKKIQLKHSLRILST